MRAGFTYELRGTTVVIFEHEDEAAQLSVANDAEAVIAELIEDGLDLEGRRVIYRDSLGMWDEIKVRDQRFDGFTILNARTLSEAMRRIGGAQQSEFTPS
jgi:hypothetical protein